MINEFFREKYRIVEGNILESVKIIRTAGLDLGLSTHKEKFWNIFFTELAKVLLYTIFWSFLGINLTDYHFLPYLY